MVALLSKVRGESHAQVRRPARAPGHPRAHPGGDPVARPGTPGPGRPPARAGRPSGAPGPTSSGCSRDRDETYAGSARRPRPPRRPALDDAPAAHPGRPPRRPCVGRRLGRGRARAVGATPRCSAPSATSPRWCGRSRSRSAVWPVPSRPRRSCGRRCATTARSRCGSAPPARSAGSASRTPSPTWWPLVRPKQPAALRMVVARALGDIGSTAGRAGAAPDAAARPSTGWRPTPPRRWPGSAAAASRRCATWRPRADAAGREARAGLALVDLSARAAAIAAAAHAPAVPAMIGGVLQALIDGAAPRGRRP